MTQRLSDLTALLRLSYLAPDIVRALLDGRQPIALTPTRLLRLSKDLRTDWREQRRFLISSTVRRLQATEPLYNPRPENGL